MKAVEISTKLSPMLTRETVLNRVEAFIAEHGMSARQFSISAVGDHRFVSRLRSGAGVTLKLIERAEAYMTSVEGAQPDTSEAA